MSEASTIIDIRSGGKGSVRTQQTPTTGFTLKSIRYSTTEINERDTQNPTVTLNSQQHIPYLNVLEFQPIMQVPAFITLRDNLLNSMSVINATKQVVQTALTNPVGAAAGTIAGGGTAGEALTAAANKLDEAMNNVGLNADNDVIEYQYNMIKSMFAGKYVSGYQLPYKPTTYLDTNGASRGWGAQGVADLERGRKENESSVVKFMKNFMPIDNPIIPTYDIKANSSNKPTIQGSFYLYNETLKDLSNNYMFLKALYSGTLPMYQLNIAKSPNIYNVEFPGHIQFMYATLEVKSTCEGQQKFVEKQDGLSFDAGYYPTIWKIEYTFECLIPWTFNQYIIYKSKGKDADASLGNNITIAGQLKRMASAHIEAFKGATASS